MPVASSGASPDARARMAVPARASGSAGRWPESLLGRGRVFVVAEIELVEVRIRAVRVEVDA